MSDEKKVPARANDMYAAQSLDAALAAIPTVELCRTIQTLRKEITRRAIGGDVEAYIAAAFVGAGVTLAPENAPPADPEPPPPNPALERARAFAQKTDAEKRAEALEAARKAFPPKGRR